MGFDNSDPGKKKIPHIRRSDLGSTRAILGLWRTCRQAGAIGSSQADIVAFVSLAVHCRRVGRNPGALFRALLVARRFSVITESEEVEALRGLREILGRTGDRPIEERQPEPIGGILAQVLP